ncbi:MAG: hypothetical protein IPI46_03475 [Bacteroidetes bacterium]|nr:hypothetical protein [Bacteroidota bacterium]
MKNDLIGIFYRIMFGAIFLLQSIFSYSQGLADKDVNWDWSKTLGVGVGEMQFKGGFFYFESAFNTPTATVGSYSFTNQGGWDILIVKIDTLGNVIWASQIGGPSDEKAYKLTLDDSANIYFTGVFSGNLTVGSSTITSNGGFDILVGKVNSYGVPLSVYSAGGLNNESPIGIAVDYTGSTYVLTNNNQFSFAGVTCPNPSIPLLKFDAMGNEVWMQWVEPGGASSPGPSNNFTGISIAYSSFDSCIVIGGNFYNGRIRLNNDTIYSEFSNMAGSMGYTTRDFYVYKIKSNGTFKSKIEPLSYKEEHMTDMVIDNSGNIYVANRFQWSLNGYASNSIIKYNPACISQGSPFGLSSSIPWREGDTRDLFFNEDDNIIYGTLWQYDDNSTCGIDYAFQYNTLTQTKSSIAGGGYYLAGYNGEYFFIGGNGIFKTCAINCINTPLKINPSPDITICQGFAKLGKECFYVNSGSPPYTYSWSPITDLDNASSKNPKVSGNFVSRTYTLTVTDQNGSLAYDTIQVTNNMPTIAYNISPAAISCGAAFSIIPYGGISYQYKWPLISYGLGYYNFITQSAIGDTLTTSLNFGSTFTITGTDANGCYNTTTYQVLLPTDSSTITFSLCSDEFPFTWNGLTFSYASTRIYHFPNGNNCDSIIRLVINQKPNTSSNQELVVCPNQIPYSWNGLTIVDSGLYSVTLVNTNGCDSVANLHLTISPILISIQATPNIFCDSGSSILNVLIPPLLYCIPAVQYTGSYYYIYQFKFNNTAIIHQSNPSSGSYNYYNQTANVIGGSVYPINFNVSNTTSVNYKNIWIDFNQDGDFTDLGELVFVDSSLTASVTGNILIPITAFNGLTRMRIGYKAYANTQSNPCNNNSNGTYEDYNLNISGGFNTISWSPSTFLNTTIGNHVTAMNANTNITYTATIIDINGCSDSAGISIQVFQHSISDFYDTICLNQLPYLWNGQTISTAGTYSQTYTNSVGCDSVSTLNLSVLLPSSSSQNIFVCSNQLPYNWNGQNISTAGTYSQTYTNSVGCDSVSSMTISILESTSNSETINLCRNEFPYLWNGQIIDSAGIYVQAYTYTFGCDSIIILTIHELQIINYYDSIAVCFNQTPYVWNDQYLDTNGNYTAAFSSSSGCDSLMHLQFNVHPLPNKPNIVFLPPDKIYVQSIGDYYLYYNGNALGIQKDSLIDYLGNGNYQVIIIDSNGCENQSDILQLNLSQTFAVWPNPFHDYLSINLIIPDYEFLGYAIYDVFGNRIQSFDDQLKYTQGSFSFTVKNLAHLPNGIYFLKLTFYAQQHVVRLLKE